MTRTIEEEKKRFKKFMQNWTGWNRESDGARWVEKLDSAGLRFVGYADEIAGINHTGWYADSHCDEILRGVVLQMPARNGCAQYLAAYADPNNRGAYRVNVTQIYVGDYRDYHHSNNEDSGARDCAYAADSFAECVAESEREYHDAWQAGNHFADLGQEIAQHRKSALALIAEIKRASKQFPPAICAVLRDHVESHLESIREAREKRDELRDSIPSRLESAFNDGASI